MGIIEIGKNTNSKNDFLIPITHLNDLLIVGDSSSGKSTVIKQLFMRLVENTDFMPLLFDENYQFDRLLEYKDLSREIIALELGKDGFIINPLDLGEDVSSAQRFVSILAGIFRESFNLNPNETYILREYISFFLDEGYKDSSLSDLGLYFDLRLDCLDNFDHREVKISMAHLKTIFQTLTQKPARDILKGSTNLNLETLQEFPVVFKFRYINPTIRIFIKNLILFQQFLYKIKNGNKSVHLTMLDPLDNISNELFYFWKEKQINEGIIGTLTPPFNIKKNYLDFFDNIISLRITSEPDIKLIKDRIHYEIKHNPGELELGVLMVKLRGQDYEIVGLDDYF